MSSTNSPNHRHYLCCPAFCIDTLPSTRASGIRAHRLPSSVRFPNPPSLIESSSNEINVHRGAALWSELRAKDTHRFCSRPAHLPFPCHSHDSSSSASEPTKGVTAVDVSRSGIYDRGLPRSRAALLQRYRCADSTRGLYLIAPVSAPGVQELRTMSVAASFVGRVVGWLVGWRVRACLLDRAEVP